MNFTDIRYDVAGGIATITINRPEKRNALRKLSWEELIRAAELASADSSVRVVVLTGAGNKAFSAGGDVTMANDFTGNVREARTHAVDRMMRLSRTLTEMDKPVIGAVNGFGVGAGAEILCFLDFVYAADHAWFHFNGTYLGGCSWWGAPQVLPLLVGLRRAEELLYMSPKFSAADAAQWGFISRVVPAAELEATVSEQARQLMAFTDGGIRLTKAAIRASRDVFLTSQLNTAEANAPSMAGGEVQSMLGAFKREPRA